MAAGRAQIVPEDVWSLAGPMLSNRLQLMPEAELQGRTAPAGFAELLAGVPVRQVAGQG